VPIIPDKIREPNETFSVDLSNPSPNAYIVDGHGTSLIANDD
jgi:hypothetical protein